ncbi:MAG: hypothetical protein R3C56_03565 [Pirellulaceae bacterium]
MCQSSLWVSLVAGTGGRISCGISPLVRRKLSAICDADPQQLSRAGENYAAGGVALVGSVDELLQLDLDAVAIATPVGTHFPLATRCLGEPACMCWWKSPWRLQWNMPRPSRKPQFDVKRVLMVDHTYLFSNSIRRIKLLVENDELGELYYIDGVRINLGLFQRDINVIFITDLDHSSYTIRTATDGAGLASCTYASLPWCFDRLYHPWWSYDWCGRVGWCRRSGHARRGTTYRCGWDTCSYDAAFRRT